MLDRIVKKIEETETVKVQVHLPRFKIETPVIDLVPPLKSLGMDLAFRRDQADFRGMGWPKGALWISQVKHRGRKPLRPFWLNHPCGS